jgi:sugar O-acyltransferase (sialic acid O-acetyltransferase NeuD family)
MSERLVILGAGELAYDILDIVEACNAAGAQWEIVGFLDDDRPRAHKLGGFEILGPISEAAKYPGCKFILGIGGDVSFAQRQKLVAESGLNSDDFATLIHPSARVTGQVTLGRGVYAAHGVLVGAMANIADHVALGPGCMVSHHVTIGAYSVAAPGACIGDNVQLGDACYIGARTVIREDLKIGEKALIGMGAAVLQDVAIGVTVVGTPARPLLRTLHLAAQLPRFDVIVPCYKYAHYLRQCVQSATTQEGVDVRILILDDASPDNTAEIGRELARNDPRIEFRRHGVNHGHIPTFNEGIDWAGGEFLLLLSADDLLLPGALQRAANVFRKHPNVTLVHGDAIMCDEPEHSKVPISTDPSYKLMSGQEFLEFACRDGKNHVFTPTAIVRTDIQKALGGYRRELLHTGDMEMWLRHGVQGDVGEIAAHQALYRVHGQNMSAQYLDLTGRHQEWVALAAIFQEYSHKIKDAPRLQAHLVEMFGKEIFYMGNTFFDEGNLDGCERCLKAALEINPAISKSRAYRRLELKRRLGPKIWSILRSMVRLVAKPEPVSL